MSDEKKWRIPRLLSSPQILDGVVRAAEWMFLLAMLVLFFAGGFLLGQLWSIGNFLIWVLS